MGIILLTNNYQTTLAILLSVLFSLTIVQDNFFTGNHAYLLKALNLSNYGQLKNDWMANTADHAPLFSIINSLIFNLFSIKGFIIFH